MQGPQPVLVQVEVPALQMPFGLVGPHNVEIAYPHPWPFPGKTKGYVRTRATEWISRK